MCAEWPVDGCNGFSGPTGGAPFPSDPGNSLDVWDALGHVVRVRSGQDDREHNPLCLRHDMMLTPQLPSIRRIRPRFTPPKTARTDEESAMARDQSRVSASRSLAKSTAWSRCQRPLAQARRYRQHVIPEPQPNSWGSMAQGIPLFKINKRPVSTWRRAKGWRPGQPARRGLGGGNSGSITLHNSSSNSGLAMCNPRKSGENTWYINGNYEEAQSFYYSYS